jgi:uncharacterized damage-inducible protein DinB
MFAEQIVNMLEMQRRYFLKTAACLKPEDAAFRPAPGMLSTAGQIAHAAQVVDWFLDGAFSPEGMNEDWEKQASQVEAVTELSVAIDWLNDAYNRAIDAARAHSQDEWQEPIAQESIMGGLPRATIFGGMADHSAHHRGSVAVYARLLGHVPEMPYM